MKNIIKFGLVGLIGLIGLINGSAQLYPPAPYSVYTTGSTNPGTLSWAVIGVLSANAGTPVLTSLSARSDKASGIARVQSYKVQAFTSANYSNSTTVVPVVSTNGFATNQIALIRHADDTYEKRQLTFSTTSSTTNLILTAAPQQAVAPGDLIYCCTTNGAASFALLTNSVAAVGPATSGLLLNLAGTRLLAGQKGLPLLLEVDGTTTAVLDEATAVFEP